MLTKNNGCVKWDEEKLFAQ